MARAADASLLAAPARASRLKALLAPLRDPYAAAGITIYAVFVLVALFADLIATHDPLEILFDAEGKLARQRCRRARDHLLGTTNLGRDIFSQLIFGTRAALLVGLTAAVVVALIGTRGRAGLPAISAAGSTRLLMRFADVALGIPFLPFVIVLAAFLGPRTSNVILGIALLLWPNTARVIRSQVLTVRERAFVEAARVTGASTWRILFVHVAPQHPAAHRSLRLDRGRLGDPDRGLVCFLGFGRPTTCRWGFMLQDAYASQALSRGAYNWFVPPGVCIVLVVRRGLLHQPRL